MTRCTYLLHHVWYHTGTLLRLVDVVRFLHLCLLQAHRHQLPEYLPVVSQPLLGGFHHAYALAEKVA